MEHAEKITVWTKKNLKLTVGVRNWYFSAVKNNLLSRKHGKQPYILKLQVKKKSPTQVLQHIVQDFASLEKVLPLKLYLKILETTTLPKRFILKRIGF